LEGGAIPRISMGVPVYNGAAHLRSALDALLAQTFQDFEIVISDNHSTDGTEAICREYASRDPRIRFTRAERNHGASWNFNRVVELSRGHYFKWASSNDLHAPEYVRRCVEVLDRRPEVVLAYAKATIIDGQGAFVDEAEDNLDLPSPDAARRLEQFLARLRLCNPVFGVTRRASLLRTGLIGNYPGSDVVLLGELALHGRFHEVPERLFSRRLDRTNFVRNESVENWQEFFDPDTTGRVFMRTWRHQYEFLMAALRAPITAGERARVVSMLCRGYLTHRHELARELADGATKTAQRAFRRGPAPRA
jgi:glycosyltransferase involved in cell wall biosynthesis